MRDSSREWRAFRKTLRKDGFEMTRYAYWQWLWHGYIRPAILVVYRASRVVLILCAFAYWYKGDKLGAVGCLLLPIIVQTWNGLEVRLEVRRTIEGGK